MDNEFLSKAHAVFKPDTSLPEDVLPPVLETQLALIASYAKRGRGLAKLRSQLLFLYRQAQQRGKAETILAHLIGAANARGKQRRKSLRRAYEVLGLDPDRSSS